MTIISVSMCSALPLASSSTLSLINFIPLSEGYILTYFYQTKYLQTLSRANVFLSKQGFKIRHKLSLHTLVCLSFAQAGLGYTFIIFPLVVYMLQERECRMRQGSCRGLCKARTILTHCVLSSLQGSICFSLCATGPSSQWEESIYFSR